MSTKGRITHFQRQLHPLWTGRLWTNPPEERSHDAGLAGLDNSSAFFGSTGDAGTRLDLKRSNSANDQRHRFIDAFVYELPIGRGKQYVSRARVL